MTIAITAASGHLGRLVLQHLQTRRAATDLVALVRTPAKAADLGVTIREADYDRPETLAPASAGASTGWDVAAAQGALFDDTHQLSRLIGHPTTPLSVSVADALRAPGSSPTAGARRVADPPDTGSRAPPYGCVRAIRSGGIARRSATTWTAHGVGRWRTSPAGRLTAGGLGT